jgi:hypothetical protein
VFRNFVRRVLPGLALGGVLLAAAHLADAANAAVTITIDVLAKKRAINANVYGLAYASPQVLTDLNVPLNRLGGNNTSRYNWQLNADNRGQDWYFESIAEPSAVAGERGDTFIAEAKSAKAQAMLTIPTIDWIAKLGPNRGKLASFSQAKYGAQTGSDWQWFPDAGNGILKSTGKPITGNDPNDANVPNSSTFEQDWVRHLVATWGTAATTGLKYYILDNEPSIWFSTHRDVHPVGPTMEEIRNKMVDYAKKIKAVDPKALVVGPEEWGWSGYVLSGYDQQYGSVHGWQYHPDRDAHGGIEYLPWLLAEMKKASTAAKLRLLDVFSVHYYPQGGEFSNDTSNAMQLRRNRSTRSLWDPSYVDETWINDKVQLIPRLKKWVGTYYASTKTAITEYNWGAEGHINGATAQADILGIFGREGLDMAARWTTPDPSTPTYKAIKLYRNYDGRKSAFGATSVSCTVPNPDNLSAFASRRTPDGALTVMVISKYLSGDTPVNFSLANFPGTGLAQRWQLTASNTITQLSNLTYTGNTLAATVPPQSVTLFVLPAKPVFTSTATSTPAAVAHGTPTTIQATVTDTDGRLNSAIVDLEVFDSAGNRVGQMFWTGQTFTHLLKKSYSWSWTTPATPGTYTVRIGVFGPNWTPLYHWNDVAATVTVS